MKARGRAFGEEAILLAGAMSVCRSIKNPFRSMSAPKAVKNPVVPEYSRDYLFSGKAKIPQEIVVEKTTNQRINKLKPHSEATGIHSSFKRNPNTGIVTGYETYELNPFTQKWVAKLRFRGVGSPHGGLTPPFILEREVGRGSGSKPIVPRILEEWEISIWI